MSKKPSFNALSEANSFKNSGQHKLTVLVTGGAGYIGSHTCKALQEAGYYPVVYDSLVSGEKDAVKWGPLVEGDLLDTQALDNAFTTYCPSAVIHFAALSQARNSKKDPSRYYTNNVSGSINLLKTMSKHNVKNIVFSSSCNIYGGNNKGLISEESSKNPSTPYAKAKYFVEEIIKDHADAYSMNYMILRYFNAAGVDVEAGLRRSPYSHHLLIPRIMRTVLGLEPPIDVFGSDYPTRDGTCVRDYIHVKDLARAHVLSCNHLFSDKPSVELNLGTGKGHSILEIIQAIEAVTDKKVPYLLKARKEGDVPEVVAKTEKAREILGFEVKDSDLKAIIHSEWAAMNG